MLFSISIILTNNLYALVVLSGDAYINMPEWFKNNMNSLDNNQKKKLEQELYEAVKKVNPKNIQVKTNGYKGLIILNPNNKIYKEELLKYVEQSKQKAKTDKYFNRISPYAIIKYTSKSYPKLVQQYKSRLDEIEKYKVKAAEMALDSGKCDFVEVSDLSTNKSSLNNLIFWVDCKNQQRFYLTENEIKSKNNTKISTQSEKAIPQQKAVEFCQNEIKRSTLIPSDLDIHTFFGTSYYKAPITSNVVVEINFDVKNAFDKTIKYKAKCYFSAHEKPEVIIEYR